MKESSKLFKNLSFGGAVSAIAGAVNDLLSPIVESPHYAWKIFVALLLLSTACFWINPINRYLVNYKTSNEDFVADYISKFWPRMTIIFLVVASVSTFVLAQITMIHMNENGYIAMSSETMARVQAGWAESLGVELQEIKSGVMEIAETTKGIKEDTAKIIEKQDIANEKLDLVKKESSDDPRKELANMGVSWGSEQFMAALEEPNTRAVRLFLKGSESPFALYRNTGSYGKFCAYLQRVDDESAISVFETLKELGVDFNEQLPGIYRTGDENLLYCTITIKRKALAEYLIENGAKPYKITKWIMYDAYAGNEQYGGENNVTWWYGKVINTNEVSSGIEDIKRALVESIDKVESDFVACVDKYEMDSRKRCSKKIWEPTPGDQLAMRAPSENEINKCVESAMKDVRTGTGVLCRKDWGDRGKRSEKYLAYLQDMEKRMPH